MEGIKRQAESQADAYVKLMDEKAFWGSRSVVCGLSLLENWPDVVRT